jgi:hypothetical protein
LLCNGAVQKDWPWARAFSSIGQDNAAEKSTQLREE